MAAQNAQRHELAVFRAGEVDSVRSGGIAQYAQERRNVHPARQQFRQQLEINPDRSLLVQLRLNRLTRRCIDNGEEIIHRQPLRRIGVVIAVIHNPHRLPGDK